MINLLRLEKWGSNSSFNSQVENNKTSGLHLKKLNKDVISFSANNKKQQNSEDPYKKINQIANEYMSNLKLSIEEGLKYLQSHINNLKVIFSDMNSGAAGVAKITRGDKPGQVAYEMYISKESDKSFDSALHEGYHILQFDNDNEAEFVKIQKMLARNVSEDSKVKEKYDLLTRIVIKQIFMPTYAKNRDRLKAEAIKVIRTNNLEKVNEFNKKSLIEPDKKLLPKRFKKWFSKLPDEKCLKYVISHTQIEIKAHSFCLENNTDPYILENGDINLSKIRDLLAIKIYKEIEEMANKELSRRIQKESLSLTA